MPNEVVAENGQSQAEAAMFEAVKHNRALGDASPVTSEDLWDRVAEDMSRKPYKALGIDLVDGPRRQHDEAVEEFMHFEHRIQLQRAEGRQHGAETRALLREEGAREALREQIGVLAEALARNGEAVAELAGEVEAILRSLREQAADIARRGLEAAGERQLRGEAARPSFSPSSY